MVVSSGFGRRAHSKCGQWYRPEGECDIGQLVVLFGRLTLIGVVEW